MALSRLLTRNGYFERQRRARAAAKPASPAPQPQTPPQTPARPAPDPEWASLSNAEKAERFRKMAEEDAGDNPQMAAFALSASAWLETHPGAKASPPPAT